MKWDKTINTIIIIVQILCSPINILSLCIHFISFISFHFVDSNEKLSMDRFTGEMKTTSKALDRETDKVYDVLCVAEDSGGLKVKYIFNLSLTIFMSQSNLKQQQITNIFTWGWGYMTCGWTGVYSLVFRKLFPSNYRLLSSYPLFMMNFGGKLPNFDNFLPISGNPPMFMENLPRKGPLFREF